MTPTQRTLKAQKELGRKCGIVERFIQRPGFGFRKDLFGIIDIIALDQEEGIIGVQSCGQAFSEHYRKMSEEHRQDSIDWLEAGGKLELWGWRKLKKKRGGKAIVWKPRVMSFHLDGLGGLILSERTKTP
jgi:hypothetical protein